MFEQNILEGMEVTKTALVRKGNKLVKKAIGKQWKLAFECCHCGSISECWCYSNKEAMIKDREEYKDNFYCSLSCKVHHMTLMGQEIWRNNMRKANRKFSNRPGYKFVRWWILDEVIEFMEEQYMDACDPWHPENSDEECSLEE